MAITIQGPDGASIDFPDGTSESEMNAAVAQAYPQPDYDYAGFQASGMAQGDNGHYPDTFKLPNHMTFSNESKYSNPQQQGGAWSKDAQGQWHFAPSQFNLRQHSPDEMEDYFQDTEPNAVLDMPKPPSQLTTALKGASRALQANLPFVDRAVAAAKPGDYAANLAAEQAKNAQFAKDNPWTNLAGAGVVGTAASGGLMLGPSFGLGGLTGAMTQAAVPSAVWGGLQGASNAPDLTDLSQTGVARYTLIGAGTGGALGAAAPLAAAGIGKAFSPLAAALRSGPGAADVAKLGGDVTAAYQNVKDLGAAYSPAQAQSLMEKIASDAADADIDPSLNPKAASIISNLQARVAAKAKSGEAITLPELDRMRQFVNDNLGGLPEPKQARFGALIKGNIDDFIKNAEPQAMVPKAAPAAPNFNPVVGPDANYVPPGSPAPGGEGAAAVPQRPVNPGGFAPPSLVTFLSRMGVKDEGGDLASMGFTKYPGLVRPMSGVPMDEARRAAAEAGYLDSDTTVDDLLDKLAKHPTYAQGADEDLAARRSDYQNQMAEYRRAVDEAAPSQIEQPEATAPAESVGESAPIPPALSTTEASRAIQFARNLAMRQYKAKALAEALDKAEINTAKSGTGGNIENATRQRLAAIMEKEPWSPDEAAQLNRMVQGTPITNTLRSVSRLSPYGNALNLVLEGGLGATGAGGPVPFAAAGAGLAAQGASALMRRSAQGQLLATILAGGKVPVVASGPGPTRSALAAALAARQQLPPQRNTGQ